MLVAEHKDGGKHCKKCATLVQCLITKVHFMTLAVAVVAVCLDYVVTGGGASVAVTITVVDDAVNVLCCCVVFVVVAAAVTAAILHF